MNLAAELSKFEATSKEYKFFEKIFEKLGPNFVRKSVEDRQWEVRSKLNKATENYFQSRILLDAIIKSADQLKNSQDTNIDLHRFNEVSSSVHSLYINSVIKYLPTEKSHKLKLFGLSQEKALKTHGNKKSESESAAFKELVEENINDFRRKLIPCIGGIILHGEDWKDVFDRTMQELESKVNLVSSKEKAKEQSKKQLREMIQTYFDELSRGVSLLSKALSLHEGKIEFEAVLSEFYHQKCHAVLLKIKCCELKLLQNTYNEETIPALKKISAQLDQLDDTLKEDQNTKTIALESYLKLGEDYERCVEEYSCLTKSIKEQQWAIDELKSKAQYEASGCD